MRCFRMPVVAMNGLALGRWAARWNERRIGRALSRFGCNVVFHSSPFYFLSPPPSRRSYRCHFDLVDDYFDEWPDSRLGRARREFLYEAMRNADSLSSCTLTLCDRVEEVIGRRPSYVPNAADVEAIRAWPLERAVALRARFSTAGARVYAYIGNHMPQIDGMELVLDAFASARRQDPRLVLLLVGPGSERVAGQRGLGPSDGVVVVGPVPLEEVWDYFHAVDAGILPIVPRPETHVSMRLRVLEFGAAGKPVLSTPLKEFERLALPHVRFVPFDREAWRRAFLREDLLLPPDPHLTARALAPFTWDASAARLLEILGAKAGLSG